MARLEQINPDVQINRWGQGFERFGFPTTNPVVREWYRQANLPRVITPDDLAGAPAGGIGLIRDIAFMTQAEPLREDMPERAMRDLTKFPVIGVGRLFTETEDGNRTTNHIIPLVTDNGMIQVVVNQAWGVHWRISEDHPIAVDYPALTKTHLPDLSLPPDENTAPNFRYIAPETLAAATEPIVKADAVARDMHSFLEGLFGRSAAPSFYTKNAWERVGVDIELSSAILSQELGGFRMLKLLLGNKTGMKSVKVVATGSGNVRTDLDWVRRQTDSLARQIGLFTGYDELKR